MIFSKYIYLNHIYDLEGINYVSRVNMMITYRKIKPILNNVVSEFISV